MRPARISSRKRGHGTHSMRSASSGSDRLADVGGARRGVEVEVGVGRAVVRPVRRELGQLARPPARLLQRLTCRALLGCLAGIDPPGGHLPAPRVADEPVAPQQQHTTIGIVDHDTGRVARHAQHVVLEALAARQLDVDERQVHPLALVDRAFAVHGPLHRAERNGQVGARGLAPRINSGTARCARRGTGRRRRSRRACARTSGRRRASACRRRPATDAARPSRGRGTAGR